jgi:TolA-binding protein
MRKNTLMLTIIAVMTLCFMPVAQAQSGNDAVTAQDVKKETQDLINTLQQYTADQRDQAVKEADQALKKLDGRIDELESRVDNNWDKMNQAARQKARANLKTLRQQRNELAEWYGSFKNSSADAWEQMKKGFSDAYQTMSDSWEKAKSEYDKDNK